MTRSGDVRRLAELLDEGGVLLRLLAGGRAEDKDYPRPVLAAGVVVGRAVALIADGFPAGAGGGGSGGHGPPGGLAEVVARGWAEHGCPAGRAAGCADCEDGYVYRPDPTTKAADEIVRRVDQAVGELRHATTALYLASKGEGKAPTAPDDDMWCANHLRHGMFEPAGRRTGRCGWCYRFALAEGVDAPKQLLDAKARGIRVTAQMIDGARPAARPGRRKRRRAA